MTRPSLSISLLATGLFLAASRYLPAQEKTPTAEALLQKMEATYAAAKSYSDTTSARYRNPDGAEGARAECRIWFVRPALFRIDGESRRTESAPPKREVIWSDGQTARFWSTSSAVTVRDKIQLAGSKMFGTYAYHIPTLLESGYGGPRRLHQISSPSLNGQEVVEGVDCYRVRGEWQGDPYEIWIGKEDHLVHKIMANYKGYEMEEMHREISLNQAIPNETFQFAPENEMVPPKKR